MPAPPTPSKLLALATGFQQSKLLFALVQLEVPTLLAGGPRSLDDIATQLGADPVAVDRFLAACVALGLLVHDAEGYRNAFETQRFLVRDTPEYLGDVFRRYERASRGRPWIECAERLRAWRRGATARAISMEGAPVGAELDGQHRLSLLTGEALASALDLSAHWRLLDLGGGTGAMSIALCTRYPTLDAIVLDVPPAVDVARGYVCASGLAARIDVRAQDFVASPLPEGCDLVLLANVLSMLCEATSTALLGRIFDSLPAGGALVLSGWMLDDDETGPLVPVLFDFEDILLGAPDVERSAAWYAARLKDAGFDAVEHCRYFDPTHYVVGRKR